LVDFLPGWKPGFTAGRMAGGIEERGAEDPMCGKEFID